MKTKQETLNLPTATTVNFMTRGSMGKLYIGNTVREAILSSTQSLVDLSEEINISENTIRRWGNGAFKTIRRSNLNSLAKALNKSIKFDDNVVELLDVVELDDTITTNKNESGPVEFSTKDFISQKDDHIKLLNKNLDFCEKEISHLIKDRDHWKEKFCECDSREHEPLLDLTKMQTLINAKDGVWLDLTPKFAKSIGYGRFDLIGQCYLEYTSKEQREKMIEESIALGTMTGDTATNTVIVGEWYLLHKNGQKVWFESKSKTINKNCIFSEVILIKTPKG